VNRNQIELIHREIDGANTADESAAFRSLLEEDAEARGLAAGLREVARLCDLAGQCAPPPHLRRAILDALPQPALVTTESKWMTPREVFRWSVLHLQLGAERMEETIMTKKAMLIGGAVVATVIVIAGIVTGFPPGSRESGTIGGVEKASRYHGRAMTEADVTIENPEIAALFQNDQILRLVQSDVFREVIANQAFRDALASQAFQDALASQAFRDALADQAFRDALADQAFRDALANQAFRDVLASQAFRDVLASQAFRDVVGIEAFRDVLADQAFRDVLANDAFQSLAQSEALSQAFMREAMSIPQ
jgi:phage head maturation protease